MKMTEQDQNKRIRDIYHNTKRSEERRVGKECS